MKTKILKSLMLIAVLLTSTHVFAYDFEVDGIYYNITSVTDLTCEVTFKDNNYNSYSGDIVIPETVTYKNKILKVLTIGNNTFRKCTYLTSIIIPNSVTTIGDDAFTDCSGLISITIPNTVANIGSKAFYYCTGLTSITIPNSVTSIGDYAFYNCSSLNELIIEEGEKKLYLEKYEYNARYLFYGCPLETVYLGRNLYYNRNNYSPFHLISTLKSVTLSNCVTSIGNYLFYGCSGLKSITIPNSVTNIGNYAFNGCSSLKEVWLEDGEKNLSLGYNEYEGYNSDGGKGLFFDCPLEKLYLGRNFSHSAPLSGSVIYPYYYGYSAFYNKDKLISLTIGNSVTKIGNFAFYQCTGLTSVTIPNSVTSIGDAAFDGCTNLSELTLGNSVTSIGSYAFDECDLKLIESLSDTPPTCGSDVFTSTTYLDGILVIKQEFLNKYSEDKIWGSFFDIRYYAPANKIQVSADSILLEIGQQTKINIEFCVDDPNGYPLNKSNELKWISDNEKVAIVSQNGVIEAIKEGHCVVSVQSTTDTTLNAFIDVTIISEIPNYFEVDYSYYRRINNRSVELKTLSNKTTIIPKQICYNDIIFNVTQIASGAINDHFSRLHIPSSISELPNDLIGKSGSITTMVIEESKTPLICGYNSVLHLDSYISPYPNPTNDVDLARCGILKGYYNGLFYNQKIKNIIINRDIKLRTYQSLTLSSSSNSSYKKIYNNIIYNPPFYGVIGLETVEIGKNVSAICESMITIAYAKSSESMYYNNFGNCDSINVVVSKNPQAPIGGLFTQKVYSNATLYIPQGYINNYNKAEGWKNFMFIKEINNANITYNVFTNFDSNCGNVSINGNTKPNIVVNENDKVVFEITPNSSYEIEKVIYNGTDVTNNIIDGKYTIEKVTEDIVLDVLFKKITKNTIFTISAIFDSNYGNVSINGYIKTDFAVNENDKVVFEITPNSGYEIEKVICNGTDVTNNIIDGKYTIEKVAEDIVLKVTFKKQSLDGMKFEVDSIYYKIISETDLTVEVTFKGSYYNEYTDEYKGDVVIPEIVIYKGIKFSVINIGGAAFKECRSLTSVNIPNSIISINNVAFEGCTGLTSITIPNSVTNIGSGAFRDCSGLTSVTIPNSVANVGIYIFGGCNSLTSINAESGNTTYDSRDNCNAIIETATNKLVAGCKNTVIPSSVTSIGPWAFYYCIGLTSITIPNSVTNIGNCAFYGCSDLASVSIGNSVTNIGNSAFRDCASLTSITIPNSVTNIGEEAFHYTGLINIYCKPTIPPTAINFSNYAIALYVPKGCKGKYTSTRPWGYFWYIIEKDFSCVESRLADNNVNVSVENGNIVIASAENVKVEVYSVNGQLIYNGNATTIPVTAKGMYIVKVGNTTHKVIL